MTVRRHCTPILALTFTLLLTLTARAQVSAYGSAALTDYVFFNNHDSAAKSDTGGIIGGAFYNFPIHSRLTAGIDARGSYRSRACGASALFPDRRRLGKFYIFRSTTYRIRRSRTHHSTHPIYQWGR
jgi:hypothetical protein